MTCRPLASVVRKYCRGDGCSLTRRHGLQKGSRRSPPVPESPDHSMRWPAAPLLDGRAAQREHDARLVHKPEFQSDEVCEPAASQSLSHDSVAAHVQGRVSEQSRENTVLGERRSPAIDGRRMTGQPGYATRIDEGAQAFFRAFRGPRRSRIVRTSSPVSGNRITRPMEKTT